MWAAFWQLLLNYTSVLVFQTLSIHPPSPIYPGKAFSNISLI